MNDRSASADSTRVGRSKRLIRSCPTPAHSRPLPRSRSTAAHPYRANCPVRADIVARTGQLARYGWAAVLRDLGKGREWAGDGQLRINRFDRPTRVLSADADLSFIPVTSNASCVGWTEPVRYAVYYPVAGRLAPGDAARHGGLGRLVGANRAALLRLLDQPLGTTHLAAACGLPVGAVGNHLRVLLDAGVVARRRSGRNVLYWRTALGEAPIAAD